MSLTSGSSFSKPQPTSLCKVMLVSSCNGVPFNQRYVRITKPSFQVGDTILYIQSFVPDCMTVLIQEYLACQSRNTSWQKIEATLFMFRSVAETVRVKMLSFIAGIRLDIIYQPVTSFSPMILVGVH